MTQSIDIPVVKTSFRRHSRNRALQKPRYASGFLAASGANASPRASDDPLRSPRGTLAVDGSHVRLPFKARSCCEPGSISQQTFAGLFAARHICNCQRCIRAPIGVHRFTHSS